MICLIKGFQDNHLTCLAIEHKIKKHVISNLPMGGAGKQVKNLIQHA
jgi:hypothetical protein